MRGFKYLIQPAQWNLGRRGILPIWWDRSQRQGSDRAMGKTQASLNTRAIPLYHESVIGADAIDAFKLIARDSGFIYCKKHL